MTEPPTLRVDVAGLTPPDAHAAILANLADITTGDPPPADDEIQQVTADLFAGLRAILERHAPRDCYLHPGGAGCQNCTEGICDDPVEWPCPDYRDVAKVLAVGLAAS